MGNMAFLGKTSSPIYGILIVTNTMKIIKCFIYYAYANTSKLLNSVPKMCFHGKDTPIFSLINCWHIRKTPYFLLSIFDHMTVASYNSCSAVGLRTKPQLTFSLIDKRRALRIKQCKCSTPKVRSRSKWQPWHSVQAHRCRNTWWGPHISSRGVKRKSKGY